MRYPAMFIAALVTPASAVAHPGPHDGMGPFEIIVHLLGQHLVQGVAVAFIAALLLFAGFRVRHRTALIRDRDNDCKTRQG